ncbi:hypothetical protein OG21DRAFT_397257 [Imleria badia]|nr:hypothetical protein OG21DRAFT_397257 [Imleria badia]
MARPISGSDICIRTRDTLNLSIPRLRDPIYPYHNPDFSKYLVSLAFRKHSIQVDVCASHIESAENANATTVCGPRYWVRVRTVLHYRHHHGPFERASFHLPCLSAPASTTPDRPLNVYWFMVETIPECVVRFAPRRSIIAIGTRFSAAVCTSAQV